MKIVLLTITSNKEPWFQEIKKVYTEKINYFAKFEIEAIKSTKIDRGSAEQKKKLESDLLTKSLKSDDLVILLDERGKSMSSIQFAQWIEKEMTYSTHKRLVFIVGGAFGVSDELKKKSSVDTANGALGSQSFGGSDSSFGANLQSDDYYKKYSVSQRLAT